MRKPILIVGIPVVKSREQAQSYYERFAGNEELKKDYHIFMVDSQADTFKFQLLQKGKINPKKLNKIINAARKIT